MQISRSPAGPTSLNPRSPAAGFAIVVALGIMAFIVLLLVSLTAFVRIESESSVSKVELLRARQAAIVALQVAIGELQEHAGADQRVTGTAELSGTPGTLYNPRWTGVWQNAGNVSKVPGRTSYDPQLLTWLVSGNEAVERPSGSSDATPAFEPDGENFSRNSERLDPDGTETAVTVVGAGSATLSVSDSDGDGIEDGGGVAVPLVEIVGENEIAQARYAFWVGDEGVKARSNLVDPLEGSGANTEEGRLRLSVPQRAAPEVFSRDPVGTSNPQLWDNAFPVNAEELERSISTSSLAGVLQIAPDAAVDLVRERFHDTTLWSEGLLTDAKNGGLKQDLTAAMRLSRSEWDDFKGSLNGGAPASASELMFPPASGGPSPDDPGGPHWDVVRSFVREGSGAGAITPRAQTPDNHGFHPIIQEFKLFVGPSIQETTDPATGDRLRSFRMHYMPSITLWNPYDRPIAATDYYLTFAPLYPFLRVHAGVNPSHWVQSGGAPDATYEMTYNIGSRDDPPRVETDRAYRFKILCPEIPPGRAIVFSAPDGGQAMALSSNEPTNDSPYNILEPGFRDGANYFIPMAGPISGTIESDDEIYHLSLSGDAGAHGDIRLGLDPVGVRENPLVVVHQLLFWYLHDQQATGSGPRPFQHLDPQRYTRVTISSNSPLGPSDFTDNRGNYFTTGATEPIAGYWVQFRMSKEWPDNFFEGPYLPHPWAKAFNPRGPYHGQSLIEAPFRAPRGFAGSPSYYNSLITQQVSNYYPVQNQISGSFTAPGFTADSLIGERSLLYRAFDEIEDFTSIGDLMHANLVPDIGDHKDNLAHMNYGANYPNYAVGSSIQSPYLDPSSTSPYRTSWPGNVDNRFYGGEDLVFYDLPYLLNESLWDRLYFSSYDPSENAFGNQRFVPVDEENVATPDEDDPSSVSGDFAVAGAFNVNSTSIDAWAAVLGAFVGVDSTENISDEDEALFTRVAFPFGDAFENGQLADEDSAWTGIRRMDTEEIRSLASAIVNEVKARGPFLGLAHFVNRDIDAPEGSQERLRGALDAAILNSGVNNTLADDADGGPMQFEAARFERNNYYGFENYNLPALLDPLTEGIPGAATQPNLLAKFGSILSPRSDTFTIRVYGDTLDPVTGAPVARVWGEAIVQRQVEPVEASSSDPAEPSSATVDTFGRRFKLIAFRWLESNEI